MAEIVGISTAETMLTVANKASERALANMMMMSVADDDGEDGKGYAGELLVGIQWVNRTNEANSRSLISIADRRLTATAQ